MDTSLLGHDKDILHLQRIPPSDLHPSDIWTDIVPAAISMKKLFASRMSGKQIAASIAAKVKVYWENMAIKEDKARVAEERRLRQLAKSVLKEVIAEWKKAVFVRCSCLVIYSTLLISLFLTVYPRRRTRES